MKEIPTSPRIDRIKRIRRNKKLRLFILFIILFISIIGALSYFSFEPRLTINKIFITGNSIIDYDDLELGIRVDLEGKYLGLFSKANFLIYPKSKIYNNLIKNFPSIEKLSIRRDGLNIIDIEIVERMGEYLYCGSELPLIENEIGENCYYINNDGYIFDNAPYFSGDIYFKYYLNIKNNSNLLGFQMLESKLFHELVRFVDGVKLLGFKPSYMVIADDGTYFLYLKTNKNNNNPKIIFKDSNDLSLILDNIITAMREDEFANEINSKYDNLLYIDLRFKNKVLYKFD